MNSDHYTRIVVGLVMLAMGLGTFIYLMGTGPR
jgi:sulfite exporter TauE/SafE